MSGVFAPPDILNISNVLIYYKSPFYNPVQPFASSTARHALRSLGFITT